MWRHARRRASSGCVDAVVEAVWLDGGPTGAGVVILLRSVSGRPGAEGAPFDGCGSWISIAGPLEALVVVLLVVVGWGAAGVRRRDWFVVSFGLVWSLMDGWMVYGRLLIGYA